MKTQFAYLGLLDCTLGINICMNAWQPKDDSNLYHLMITVLWWRLSIPWLIKNTAVAEWLVRH